MGTNNNDKDMAESHDKEKEHESDNEKAVKLDDNATKKYMDDHKFTLDSKSLDLEEQKSIRDDSFRKEELKDHHETELLQIQSKERTDLAAIESINKTAAHTQEQFSQIMTTPLTQTKPSSTPMRF